MLGRIPPFILAPVGLILVLAVAGLGYWFMVKPTAGEIAETRQSIQDEEQVAAGREEAEAAREEAQRNWETDHARLAQLLDERSIPISSGHPVIGMVSMWREVRDDLPRLVEKLVRDSGCVIIQGHPGWVTPMEPLDPGTEWYRFPIGTESAGQGTVSPQSNPPIWVAGTLEDVERLYKSLRNFPRVITIQHLGLIRLRDLMDTEMYDTARELLDAREDEIVVAPLSLTVWLAVEVPPGEAGAGGAGAGAGAGGGGMMGPGAGGMPGMGGMGPGGAGGMAPGAPGGGSMPSGAPGGAGGGNVAG